MQSNHTFNFGAYPQELINKDEPYPLSGNLADLVQTRYKELTFEQNVCSQFMRPAVRRHTYTHLLAMATSLPAKPTVRCVVHTHRLSAPTDSWSRGLPWTTRGAAACWSKPSCNF